MAFPKATISSSVRLLNLSNCTTLTLLPTGFIFAGALFGFVLARLQYLDFNERFCPSEPAEDGSTGTPDTCYWVSKSPRYKIGMIIHLATVLPAAFLAVFQFIPVIRHRFRLYHRVAGYTIILLIMCGNAGAILVSNHAMGGDLPTQTFVGFIAIATTCTFSLAVYNIKRLQIDQHRAWMLRTWFYLGFIVTLRIIQAVVASIVSLWPAATRYDVMDCTELAFIYRNYTALYSQFPACHPNNAAFAPDGQVVVKAHLAGAAGPNNAALEMSFATAGFLALILHAVGVEVYLRLTPRESERLRVVSYERQLEKGMKNPGSAGLVAERLGDADAWLPRTVEGSAVEIGGSPGVSSTVVEREGELEK